MLIKSLLLDLKIKLWFDNINLYRWISCCPFLHGFFLKFLLLCISLSFVLFSWFLEQLHENDQNLCHCNHNPLRITNWWEHVQYLITINLERKDLFYWGCNTQAIKQTDIICSLPFSYFNSLLFFIRWTRKHSIDERFVAGKCFFFLDDPDSCTDSNHQSTSQALIWGQSDAPTSRPMRQQRMEI